MVMHRSLKRNMPIKIINPTNSIVIETKIYKKANYPKIFTIVSDAPLITLGCSI